VNEPAPGGARSCRSSVVFPAGSPGPLREHLLGRTGEPHAEEPDAHVVFGLTVDNGWPGGIRTFVGLPALGVYGERAAQYRMVALDIEATAPLAAIVAALRKGVDDGSWEYEEGRVTQAWIAATEP